MADFKFFLNRQGVRGNKGEQGEQGYSPRITVKTETAAEYVLNVQNEDGSFDTPNLRGNAIENLGGTYVRFNQDTEQMYTDYADTASTTSQGEVVLSTYEDLASGGDESEVTTSKDVHDFVEAKISEASVNYVDIDDYTQKMGELDSAISDLDNNKLDFTDLSNTLVAGTNITITPNAQTGKITIAGEPVDQAQADWNQDDTDAPDYIKNKPTIPEAITVDDNFSTTSTNPVENRLITNAINLISNELEEFADKDLSNLSADGESRLHALKAYSDNGEVLTDAKALSCIKSYAHSTFDLSKFTVVGSPNITDDGVASGFSSGSAILISNTFDTTKNYSVKSKFNFATATSDQTIFGVNTPGLLYLNMNANRRLVLTLSTNTGNWDISSGTASPSDKTIILNTDVWIELKRNGTDYEVNVSYDNQNWVNFITISSANNIGNGTLTNITLGSHSAFYSVVLQGSIDLKQFSITVDGVEVFSGNKTGIDTIKPDDYTVVGTPTISADGVASGFSSSNYLTLPIEVVNNIINSETFKCTGEFTFSNNVSGVQWIFGSFRDRIGFGLIDGYLKHSYNSSDISSGVVPQANTTYKVEFGYDGSKAYINVFNQLGVLIGSNAVTKNKMTNSFTYYIGLMVNSFPFLGSIDLNSFKIYVDGNLVYQPCLKIPYTQSKTGSKIVNAVYRDRVNDMAEQFGSANYYTLDEDNGNFTLPRVELYGLIEKAASTVPSGVVQSSTISNIVSLTQTEYDALTTKDSNTFYVITPST